MKRLAIAASAISAAAAIFLAACGADRNPPEWRREAERLSHFENPADMLEYILLHFKNRAPLPSGLYEAAAKSSPEARMKVDEVIGAWREGAAKGDPYSMLEYGKYLMLQNAPHSDATGGLALIRAAADSGSAEACGHFASLFGGGAASVINNIAPDPAKCFFYYKKGADLGDVSSMYKVGIMLLKGEGAKKDEKAAAEYLEKCAASFSGAAGESSGYDALNAALALAGGFAGDGARERGAEAVEKIAEAAAGGRGGDLLAARLCEVYSEGIFVEKSREKAMKALGGARDKAAAARIVLRDYEARAPFSLGPSANAGIHMPIPFGTAGDVKILDNPEERARWRKYLEDMGDPLALLEKKCSEILEKSGSLPARRGYRPALQEILAADVSKLSKGDLAELAALAESADSKIASGKYRAPFARSDLFELYIASGEFARARKWLEENLAGMGAGRARVAAALAATWDRPGFFAGRKEEADRIIEEAKKGVEAEYYESLGGIYSGDGRHLGAKPDMSKAERNLMKAAELGSQPAGHRLRALLRDDPERYAELVKGRAWHTQKPPHSEISYTLACADFRCGKYEKALKEFESAAGGGGEWGARAAAAAYYMRSSGLGAPKDGEGADAWLGKITDMPPENLKPAILVLLGADGLKVENSDAGIRFAEQALLNGMAGLAAELGDAYVKSSMPNRLRLAESAWLRGEKAGEPACVSRLSNMYAGISPKGAANPKKALEYMAKAAAPGRPLGEYETDIIMNLYMDAGDFTSAAEFAKSRPGNASLMMFLANCHREGKGVEKDVLKAAEYETAALACPPESLNRLGINLDREYVKYLPNSPVRAREICEKAVGMGADPYWLAEMLIAGRGGPADPERGIALMEKTAERDPSRYSSISAIYKKNPSLRNEKKAFEAMKKCVELCGRPDAFDLLALGAMYLSGYGTEKDPEKAAELFERAFARDALYGSFIAAEALAACLETGLGTQKDEGRAEAIRSWIRSFDGDAIGQIGDMYSHLAGRYADILPRDPDRAAHWYSLGAAKGSKYCSGMLEKLGKTFPPLTERERNMKRFAELSEAAAKGDADAETELALMLIDGPDGIKSNLQAGIVRLKNAASKGSVRAAESIKMLFEKWKKDAEK